MSSGTARRWVFTSYDTSLISNLRENPPSNSEVETQVQILLQNHKAVFAIWQIETCPTTQREHIQGYARFSGNKRLGGMRKIFEANFQSAKGDEQSNINYCSKTESRVEGPWTFGTPSRPGKRNDVESAVSIVRETGSIRKVVEVVTSYQAIRCAELVLKYIEPARTWKPDVYWYHGSTGGGKTRKAMDKYPNAYISGKNLKWWEGYDGHQEVIIDDFRADFCTFHEFLRILDRYAYRVEVKGGSRQLLAKVIVITCPYKPEVLYNKRTAEDIGQLLRRIDETTLIGQEVVREEYAACAPFFKQF